MVGLGLVSVRIKHVCHPLKHLRVCGCEGEDLEEPVSRLVKVVQLVKATVYRQVTSDRDTGL